MCYYFTDLSDCVENLFKRGVRLYCAANILLCEEADPLMRAYVYKCEISLQCKTRAVISPVVLKIGTGVISKAVQATFQATKVAVQLVYL